VTDGLARPARVRGPVGELRFVVVGGFVADCFVRTPHLPAWGDVYEGRSIRTSPGGKGLSQAVVLARLGAWVSAVGIVGDDGPGRDILAALDRDAIDVGGVQVRGSAPSGRCV
jgi:ribokinase